MREKKKNNGQKENIDKHDVNNVTQYEKEKWKENENTKKQKNETK